MYHTSNLPKDYSFDGKHVAVISNRSTGVQVITALGKQPLKQPTTFQCHLQYSIPSGDGPIYADYDEIWDGDKNSIMAFGFKESTSPAMTVLEEAQQRIYYENRNKSNGFRFMFGTFYDLTYNPQANKTACEFMRSKIRETVNNPEKARKLLPDEPYARRPFCDADYYEAVTAQQEAKQKQPKLPRLGLG